MHTRNTVIMAVILVLLGAFVYFYEIRGREAREEADRQAELLLDFEPEQVTGLTLTTESGTVAASRADGRWSIDEPRPVEADGEELDAVVDNLHTAAQERLIAEEPEDLGAFGLAEPDARAVLRLDDGRELSLAVGNDTPVGFNLYALADDGRVYSAPRALRGQLAKSLHDLRDRSILSFDETAVRRIELQAPSYTASLSLEDPEGENGGTWQVTAPVETRADEDTVADLLDELSAGEAEAFVLDDAPSDEQLEAYGLASPETRVTLWTADDASHGLLLGGESEDPAGRYAMRAGGSSVFVVSEDLLELIPDRVAALRNRQVLAVARERVRALELREDGEVRRIERDGTDWRITAPRELGADASAVSRLLGSLVDLRAEDFASGPVDDTDLELTVELAPAGDAETTATETLTLRVGSETQSVAADGDAEEAGSIDVRRVAVAGDDTVYLVSEEQVEELRVSTFDLRDKTLVELSQADLTAIEITTGDGDSYRVERDGEGWALAGGDADPTEATEDLLWELNYLRMEGVAAEDGEPGDFGLASPRYRVVARAGDDAVASLSIGDEVASAEDGERVYAQVDGVDGIYEVSASLADAIAALVESLAAP